MSVPTFSIADQIACVRREIGMRERVYPKWVSAGRMKQDAADREIAAMRAVLATLESNWLPIDSAPHAQKALLGWFEQTGEWNCVVGCASWGQRVGGYSNISYHSRATHWRPLPEPPQENNGLVEHAPSSEALP